MLTSLALLTSGVCHVSAEDKSCVYGSCVYATLLNTIAVASAARN